MIVNLFDTPNLPITLINIQPQLSPDDDIYIFGNSETIKTAKRYGTRRSTIFVDVQEPSLEEGLLFLEKKMKDEKHSGILVLRDILVSQTFISNLNRAIKSDIDIFTPLIGHESDPNFIWFNQPTQALTRIKNYDPRCFFTKRSGNRVAVFKNELAIAI